MIIRAAIHVRSAALCFSGIPWMGSLLAHGRDASGQYYHRNRYYDPSAGRFTQEDQIGRAGGINLYGYAGGDPISYSDPYGLCPAHLYNKETKRCPGGMTRTEYNDVEDAIGTLRPGSERNRLVRMLEGGDIRKVERTYYGRPAQANYTTIDITAGFFSGNAPGFETGYDTPGERGWVLGHELGHIVQWGTGKFIRDLDNPNARRNYRLMWNLFASQRNGENPLLQADADLMGCKLATQPGIWQNNCNP